jgi:uncharacterized SAM-binding protein YcdF (DUF218 family)
MSVALGKLLSKLVMPVAAVLALIALALLLLAAGRRRSAAAALVAAFAVLAVSSLPPCAERLAAALERAHPPQALDQLVPADAILLLGGATRPPRPPREFPELGEAGDRVLHAARLYHAGKAPLVVVSGGGASEPGALPTEAARLTFVLEALGVPASAILREEASVNTRDNCVNAKRLLDERGARDVLLVTSALHMRRAFATCRTAGLAVRAAPTDYLGAPDASGALRLAPDAGALLITELSLHELLGFWIYERRGWIDASGADSRRAQ